MKIAIVTDAWEPQVNGVVVTLKMTCRELEAMGHEVVMITPADFKSLPCPTYPDIRLAMASRHAVEQRLDAMKPDGLHLATEGPLGWAARAVAIHRGWLFTTAYHSRFPEYLHLRTRVPLSWSYAALRHFHHAGHATLVTTNSMIDDLVERGFDRCHVWTRGVDLDAFSPHGARLDRGKAPVFLYVGRLAVEKNIDAFLKLDLPGEKWVAGIGPEEARLKRCYPGVRWFGVLRGDDLATLYRTADVVVFPSLTDTFGLVMVEAMACGTPVAAFPVTGPKDVVDDQGLGGILDPDLWRACIHALGCDRDKVRAHAEQYHWRRATEQFMAHLPLIVHGGSKVSVDRAMQATFN
ncbi:MAG: glycosyltransferase family 4 protein [Leptothrix ochracea]|uniref:glycosyltransferase family 4 protein n=1 Tax=Leptothrix ochracea TaxID=735331 RepID=UPI0034E19892